MASASAHVGWGAMVILSPAPALCAQKNTKNNRPSRIVNSRGLSFTVAYKCTSVGAEMRTLEREPAAACPPGHLLSCTPPPPGPPGGGKEGEPLCGRPSVWEPRPACKPSVWGLRSGVRRLGDDLVFSLCAPPSRKGPAGSSSKEYGGGVIANAL